MQRNVKLQPVTPSMPLEALLIPVNVSDSQSYDIYGGKKCNSLLLFELIQELQTRDLARVLNAFYLGASSNFYI